MPFVELFAPRGSLAEDRRTQIGEKLVAEVMRAEGAPDTEAARSISWLTITEIDDWVVGGDRTTPGEPPRFVVKVSVPAGSMNEAKRTDIVERVTKVLADRDDQFQKLLRDGNKLLTVVKQRRKAIHQLLVNTDQLAKQLSGLVIDNQKQLAPALKQLRQVVQVLQDNRDNLTKSIKNLGPFLQAFSNVLGNGRWFDSYIDALLQPYEVGAPPARPQGGDRSGSAATQTGSPGGSPTPTPSATPTPTGSAAPPPGGSASPSTTASPGR